MNSNSVRASIVLVVLSSFLALVSGELILRMVDLPREDCFLPARFVRVHNFSSDKSIPGVTWPNKFSTNDLGIRGDDFPAAMPPEKKFLVFGGSTVEGLYLDDAETWPYRLQEELSARGEHVWVGNVGRSGETVERHGGKMRAAVRKFPSAGVFVLMAGVNDFQQALLAKQKKRSFFKNLAMIRALRRLRKGKEDNALSQPKDRLPYAEWRKQRQNAAQVLSDFPSRLNERLEAYGKELRRVIRFCQKNSKRLIVVTQPAIWRGDLSEFERSLLWFGWQDRSQGDSTIYYDEATLARGMALWNAKTMEICRQENAECFDMTAMVPKDTSVFYDDCHLNEPGAALVGKLVADFINSKPEGALRPALTAGKS